MSNPRENVAAYLKKHPILVIGASLSLILAVALYIRHGNAPEIEAELQKNTEEGARLKTNIEYASSLQEQTDVLTKANADVASRLVRPSDVAGNLQYFLKMESDSGVKLAFRSPPGPRGTTKPPYIAVPYALDIQGNFRQAMTFVRKLETGDRFCRILKATLRRDSGENATKATDLIRVNLTIELLGQP